MWIEDFATKRHTPWVQDLCNWADFIFVQRNILYPEVWDACDYWRGLGKSVVADLDDAYTILPVTNPAHDFWIKNTTGLSPPPLDRLYEGLRHVDALTSPSHVILDDWKDVVEGYWVPNMASLSWWRNVRRRTNDENQIILGWGGSVSHYDSFWDSGIREALKVITREYRNVYLMICGNDKRLRFKAPAPKDKVRYQIGVAPWLWPQIVSTFDVGLAPLAGDYDRRRSWIKVQEYALAGIPSIFTDYEPYQDLKGQTVGIPVENSAENWYHALRFVIENYQDLRIQAEERRNWALQNLTMLPNVDTYVSLFNAIPAKGSGFMVPGVEPI